MSFRMVDQFGHPMDEPCDCGKPLGHSVLWAALLGFAWQIGVALWFVVR